MVQNKLNSKFNFANCMVLVLEIIFTSLTSPLKRVFALSCCFIPFEYYKKVTFRAYASRFFLSCKRIAIPLKCINAFK